MSVIIDQLIVSFYLIMTVCRKSCLLLRMSGRIQLQKRQRWYWPHIRSEESESTEREMKRLLQWSWLTWIIQNINDQSVSDCTLKPHRQKDTHTHTQKIKSLNKKCAHLKEVSLICFSANKSQYLILDKWPTLDLIDFMPLLIYLWCWLRAKCRLFLWPDVWWCFQTWSRPAHGNTAIIKATSQAFILKWSLTEDPWRLMAFYWASQQETSHQEAASWQRQRFSHNKTWETQKIKQNN